MQPTFRFTNNLLPSHHPAAAAVVAVVTIAATWQGVLRVRALRRSN